jgi:tRNA-N(6)-(isopentenyl)adenosine-37 thiotransferase enzyme MiaB
MRKVLSLARYHRIYGSSVIWKRSASTLAKKESMLPDDKLTLKDFLVVGKNLPKPNEISPIEEELLPPYLQNIDISGQNRRVYFDVYGCQMNVNDTEIVWAVLKAQNYQKTENINEADVILMMTCSIREGAETKIWNRLVHLKGMKKRRSKKLGPLQIGILGCMAERLKTKIVEQENEVDVIAGPDSYKDLPRLLALGKNGVSAINVLLSLDETYADLMPVKLDQNAVTAYASIMRGCDNMCTYCIVPFTRGRERSRPIDSIEREVRTLVEKQGIKEVTLLGQNVNSFRDMSKEPQEPESTQVVPGFKTVYKARLGGLRFAELLERIANISPELRIRFTSPHPKDFPNPVLEIIQKYPNICNSLHIPAQSGNSAVLERMRRGYTREAYLELVKHIREKLPGVSLSSDFICGFCGETNEEFEDTLTMIDEVKYNVAYLFPYSMREVSKFQQLPVRMVCNKTIEPFSEIAPICHSYLNISHFSFTHRKQRHFASSRTTCHMK